MLRSRPCIALCRSHTHQQQVGVMLELLSPHNPALVLHVRTFLLFRTPTPLHSIADPRQPPPFAAYSPLRLLTHPPLPLFPSPIHLLPSHSSSYIRFISAQKFTGQDSHAWRHIFTDPPFLNVVHWTMDWWPLWPAFLMLRAYRPITLYKSNMGTHAV